MERFEVAFTLTKRVDAAFNLHICGDKPLLWQMQFIDRIAHDSYRINITSIDKDHDVSMREVYGLDKALRQ